MSPDPPHERTRELVVLLAAASFLLMGAVGAMVYYITASTMDEMTSSPEPEATVPATAPSPPRATSPAPLGDVEGGYGRPEPLFGEEEPPISRLPPGSPASGPERGTLPGRFGNPLAEVHIVVFNDFECPYCSRLEATFQQLHQLYPTQVELWFRDFPLASHEDARAAHMAARCADDQGRFWAMNDAIFADQTGLATGDLLSRAATLNIDLGQLETCIHLQRHSAAIDADIAAGSAAGVTGTPSSFVNGTLLRGAQPVSAFVELIDGEL